MTHLGLMANEALVLALIACFAGWGIIIFWGLTRYPLVVKILVVLVLFTIAAIAGDYAYMLNNIAVQHLPR